MSSPPPPGDMPPPPSDGSFQVVHIASLEAVLAKLNIKIPVEDFIKAIHDEEEARRVEPTAEATQLLARSLQRTSPSFPVTLPPMEPAGTLNPVPKFIPRSPTPTNDDPRAKERRRRLVELAEQTFPDGKAPDPYTFVELNSLRDAATDKPLC